MKSRAVPLFYANYILGAAWAIITTILLALALDSFVAKPDGDASIYLYVAKGILEGEIPYVDRWDNKGPLLYLLDAAGLFIHPTWGIWVVQGLFLLASSAFALLVLRKGFGTTPALFALALFLIYYSRFAPPGNFTEQYGFLFQFSTLYLFFHSQEWRKRARSRTEFALLHAGIGVLGAASFLLRPNLVALWIAIGIYWLLFRRDSLGKLAWAIVGGASPLFLVAAFFVAIGAWNALWDAVFEYNFAHSNVSLLERFYVLTSLTDQTLPVSLIVIVSWCIGVLYFLKRRNLATPFSEFLPLALVLLPIELVSLSLSGFSHNHYYLTVLPAVMLLVAFLVWIVREQRPVAPLLLSGALLFLAASISFPAVNFEQLAEKYTFNGFLGEDNLSRTASRISEITEPDDHILVWGKGARIHLLADRDAPSRYFFHHPLIKPHYTDQAMLDEFMHDIQEHMPAVIVDSRFFWFPPLARAERADWQPLERQMHDLEDLKPFFEFVEANYIAVETLPPFTIYNLRRESANDRPAIRGELIISSTYDVYLDGRTLTYVKRPCVQDDALKGFILHVIPEDKSVIGGNAQETLDFILVEGKDWQIGEACIVSRDLPNYPIASIRTGQYNASKTAHDWLNEYHFPELQ